MDSGVSDRPALQFEELGEKEKDLVRCRGSLCRV